MFSINESCYLLTNKTKSQTNIKYRANAANHNWLRSNNMLTSTDIKMYDTASLHR